MMIWRIKIKKGADNVNHLKPRIIDVITDLRWKTEPFKYSCDGISYDRVPKVADVHGLVWIHARMLDENLLHLDRIRFAKRRAFRKDIGKEVLRQSGPIDLEVEIPRRTDGHFL